MTGTNRSGCIMLSFDKVHFNSLVARLDIDDTYLSGSGIEVDPHVTVVYGIDMEKYGSPEDLEFIKTSIEESGILKRTFHVKSISQFKNEEKDVLKLDFKPSEGLTELRALNSLFTKHFDVKSDFPDYKPHCTIAYMQKGSAKQFLQKLSNVPGFQIRKSVFSSQKEEGDDKYITKTLSTNRKIIAKDYVKSELF